jgi:hypothetical protein
MLEPLLFVKCRCGRGIHVHRRDVPETHRCPGCSARFTILHMIGPDGLEIVTPKYLDAAKPAPVPQAPAPVAGDEASPDERLKLAGMLPTNMALREYIAVLNAPGEDRPFHANAASALVKLGPRAVPFLAANLLVGPFDAHTRTLQCLLEIGDVAAVGPIAEYARSLKGSGHDDLKAEAEKIVADLVKDGR